MFASFTWDGGGGDANWTTGGNWVGDIAPTGSNPVDTLIFPNSASQKSNTNDFADGTAFEAMTLQGSGYTLAGNRITLGTIALADTSLSGANEISFDIELGGACTIIDDEGASDEALTLSGVISGSGSLARDGTGSVILTSANTYTGGTTLSGGNTFANNASGSAFGTGTVTNTAGTLRGHGGFSGALTHNAGLAPGAANPGGGAAGAIATGSVTFGSSASFGVNVFGTTAGSGYDQLVVTGAVDLDSGHSLIASGTYSATGGERLFIIINDGTDMVVGTFAGLDDPDNDTVTINGAEYRISYTGDSGTNAVTGGNDVVLYVEAGNAAPVNTVPGTQTTDEDTAKVFSTENGNAISIADADAGSDDVQVALSVNQSAAITIPTPGSLISAGANGSSAVTLTGSTSAINAALNGMSVTPAANSIQTVTLTVATSDLGHNGGGGAQTDSDNVVIGVTAINDAPVNNVPATQSTPQNVAKVFSSANSNLISVADDALGGIAVTLTATDGTVTLSTTSGISITGGANGTATVAFTGSVAQVNTALGGLTFTPTADFTGTGTLQIATSDQGNTGAGGTLTDTDTVNITVASAGSIALSSATYSVAESVGAGIATITVNRTGGSAGQATIGYATSNGSATAGTDYTAVSGTLTFADGQTSKTFDVPVSDDALDEADETVGITLSGVTGAAAGAQATATLTLTDDDATPTLAIGDAGGVEGDVGTSAVNFTVTLSAPSGQPVRVNYSTADGSATLANSDYSSASGILTFTPGQTTKTITVNATGDAAIESNETFTVGLSDALNATVSDATGTGTILDDDAATPIVTFLQDVVVTEGDSGTTNAVFTVKLLGNPAGTVTVGYGHFSEGNTATVDVDFVGQVGTLTFSPGDTTKTITVAVNGDTRDEENESFGFLLNVPTGGAMLTDGEAFTTILDNDAPPSLSIANASGVEGTQAGGTLDFDVNLSAASAKTVTVTLMTGDETATSGADFTALAEGTTLTFAPGETNKTVTINTTADALDEDSETFTLVTGEITNATIDDGQAVGTITDDDPAPSLSIGSVTFAEPSNPNATTTGTFTVTLSAAGGKPVTVDFATSNGTATAGSDYTANSGTLTFAPGETTKTIAVTGLFDGTTEPAETFAVSLSNATNTAVQPVDDLVAIGTINDTAPNAVPVAANDVVTLAAGQSSATINVLDNDTDAEGDALTVAVTGSPASGTAVANADGTITYTPADASTAGSDAFTYTVTDAFGGTDTATVSVTITGNGTAPNPINPARQDVFVAATGGDDLIQIVRVGRSIQILVNGQDQGTFTSKTTGNIVISGGDGDDTIVLGKVKTPVLFNGGDGDDELGGGSRGDILIGGPGADTLNGGAGRDILVGGDGADTITGLGASDILIAGTTVYDADTAANRAAVNDLLAVLAAGGRYSAKLDRFTSFQGVGTSNARLIVGATVFDDGDADEITGGGAADFYAASVENGAVDVLNKKARNESIIEL